jgi:enoyl-CoA hydratase/carnithine racemase
MSEYETITYEVRDGVGLVTLNRPERLNAWVPQMSVDAAHAIGAANDDPSVGAIVMTGAGRGFCAGADMSDTFQSRIDGVDPGENTAGGSGGLPEGLDWVALVRAAKPLVAAVNGAAVGVGLTQILPFDVIVASEKAKFSMAFIKVGLVPELASTHYLVQRMGFGHASEMCLSGRLYSGQEAFDLRLADHLVPPESVLDRSLEIARELGANPAPQLRMIKRLLTENAAETDLRLVQRRESKLLRECWETPEHKAAVQAFLAQSKKR